MSSSTLKYYRLATARMPKGNIGGWQERHKFAVAAPKGAEVPLVALLDAWTGYANQHAARFESGIGADYVLGPAWAEIGRSIRTLLNGESGRLDCGTLDGFILDTLTSEGFEEE